MSGALGPRKTSRSSHSHHHRLDGEDSIKRFIADTFPDLLTTGARGTPGEPARFYPVSRIGSATNYDDPLAITGRLGIVADSLIFVPWPAQPASRPEQFRSRFVRSVGGFIKRNGSECHPASTADRTSERETIPLRFPLNHIKEYGVTGAVFSLSCGRHFQTGPTVVNFKSDHAMQLFDAIQQSFQNMSNELRLKNQAALAASTSLRSSSSTPLHHRSDSPGLKKGGGGTPKAVLRSLRGVANRYARRRYSLQTQAQQQITTGSDYHKCPRRRFVTFRKPHYPNTDDGDNNNKIFLNNNSSHPSSNSGSSNSSAGSGYDYHRSVVEIPASSFRALTLSPNDRRDGVDDIFAEIKLPDAPATVSLGGSIRVPPGNVVHLFKPRLPTPPVARRASDDTDNRNCYQNTSNILSDDMNSLSTALSLTPLNQLKPPFGLATEVGCRTGICLPPDFDDSIYHELPKRVEVVNGCQTASNVDDIYVDQTLDYTTVQVIGNHITAQALQNKEKCEEELKFEVETTVMAPPAAPPEIKSCDQVDKPQRPPIRKLSLGRVIVATNAISKFLARKTPKTPTPDVPVSSSTPTSLNSESANLTNGALNYVTVDARKMRAFELLGLDNS